MRVSFVYKLDLVLLDLLRWARRTLCKPYGVQVAGVVRLSGGLPGMLSGDCAFVREPWRGFAEDYPSIVGSAFV